MIEFIFGIFVGVIATIGFYKYIELENHKDSVKEQELIDKITAVLMERIQDIENELRIIKETNVNK